MWLKHKPAAIEILKHGTTQIINTLLERRGARTAPGAVASRRSRIHTRFPNVPDSRAPTGFAPHRSNERAWGAAVPTPPLAPCTSTVYR